jgi:hypothetical protein
MHITRLLRWSAGLGLAASGALAVGSQVAGASVTGTGSGSAVNDITSGSTASFTELGC